MKVSKKAYYGLRAVLALAHAREPVSIHSLAEAERLPEDYLEKILQTLRRAKIVRAKKGVAGGYELKRPVGRLSVWDVFFVLDGPVKVFAPNIHDSLPCLHPSHCQSNEVWRLLEKKIEGTLSRMSVASLIPRNPKK